jgi:hypothetical protein
VFSPLLEVPFLCTDNARIRSWIKEQVLFLMNPVLVPLSPQCMNENRKLLASSIRPLSGSALLAPHQLSQVLRPKGLSSNPREGGQVFYGQKSSALVRLQLGTVVLSPLVVMCPTNRKAPPLEDRRGFLHLFCSLDTVAKLADCDPS